MRAMIQSLCVPYIVGKAQTHWPIPRPWRLYSFSLIKVLSQRVFLGEVFNEEVLQGSKLDLGSTKVKLEGEC